MLHALHKHRRLISAAVLAALTVWLSAMLATCLLTPMQPMPEPMAATAAEMQPETAMASDMGPCPGGICATMQSDRDIAADQDIVPTTPKLLLVAVLLAAVLFAMAKPQRDGRRPPEPLLPKRSPFLRFYALRI